MVLWELTLATAYVLGLPRTYRLALRLQRRLIGPKQPRLRDFVYRRTRDIFSVALNVHKEVQRRDISVGRNIGNRILRLLDRMRPQANISGSTPRCEGTPTVKNHLLPEGKNSPKKTESKEAISGDNAPSKKPKVEKPKVNNPPYRAYGGGQSGQSIRSRFSSGLSRLTPKVRSQSLPVAAMGLWWQPARKNMEFVLLRQTATPQAVLSDFARSSRVLPRPSASVGLTRGLIREDIAAWIYQSHQGRQ